MTWAKFNQTLARLGTPLAKSVDIQEFYSIVERMVDLLDEADGEDFFGTEGWKHRLGLED